jgi:hypothetical protein
MKKKVPFKYTDSGSPNWEINDCAVAALSIATGVKYGKAHQYLTASGRKPTKGTPRRITNLAYKTSTLGRYRIKMIYGAGRRRKRTLGWFLKENRLPKRCIVRIFGHVFAVIDGVIRDHEPQGLGCQVRNVWEVSKYWKKEKSS